MSGVSSEYKDLVKFAENTNHDFCGEELEDYLRRLKKGITVCRHSKIRQITCMFQVGEYSTKFQKAIGQTKNL